MDSRTADSIALEVYRKLASETWASLGEVIVLEIDEIAFRSAALWIIGIATIGIVSGYAARPGGYMEKSRRISGWSIIPVGLGKIGFMVGAFGLALIVRRVTGNLNDNVSIALSAGAFIAALWLSLIAVQFSQNFAYKFVGAPTQRIRWSAFDEERKKRSRARREVSRTKAVS